MSGKGEKKLSLLYFNGIIDFSCVDICPLIYCNKNIHKDFLILSLLFLSLFKCHDKVIYRGRRGPLTVKLQCDTTSRSNTSNTNSMQNFFFVPAASLSVKNP